MCVYCYVSDYKLLECIVVMLIEKCKGILMIKKLCFNCIGFYYRFVECKSIVIC